MSHEISSGEFSYKGVTYEIGKIYQCKDGVICKLERFDTFYEKPILVTLMGKRKSGRWVSELDEVIDELGKLIIK